MLQLTTKWFTNTLAKKSMLNNDFIQCSDNKRLYVISYGNITRSGKNTYNIELRDENENVLSSQENLYLDAITKLILGISPKSKANKETNEETKETNKPNKQTNKKVNKDSLLLTFDDAFEIACKKIEAYKEVAKLLGKYDTKDAINLTLHLIKEANESEKTRIKEAKKQSELASLYQTLEIAKTQGNAMLIDAITQMIANKEKE